ncbi:MAG: aldolase [Planctomycetota bacterium]|nr:MAG: aldolase [Planctomycetota bacterium]
MVQTSLNAELTGQTLARLRAAHAAAVERYPGEGGARQPVHTVYGGAHLFRRDSAPRLGEIARRLLASYAPDFAALARALGLAGSQQLPEQPDEVAELGRRLAAEPARARREQPHLWLAWTVYERVVAKLEREPVEDFRIDFEDGYGVRPDAEEDAAAEAAALEVAAGMEAGTLPPFIGIRIKPLNPEMGARAARTLDLFVSALAARTGGRLPEQFVITLPKVTMPEQVAALVELCRALEARLGLGDGALRLELMVETPQAILDAEGRAALPALVAAGGGRVRGAHFGTYDYTALCGITAAYQAMRHPACDFAKHVMQVALAGTGVWLSDGATTILPVPPHRAPAGGPPLGPREQAENRAAVHRAWRQAYEDARHSLQCGFYQGWDLHPGQLVSRYAACYAFFLEGLEAASERLRNFIDKAAQATLSGFVFDDAATGQGLLNYFIRALQCGAIGEQEVAATGLSLKELQGRSFAKIIEARRRQG